MSAPGRGHFLAQGNNLNNLGRGPLGETMYQKSKLLDKKICKVFPYVDLCKTSGPQRGAIFYPRALT